jgi:hypothetical protein
VPIQNIFLKFLQKAARQFDVKYQAKTPAKSESSINKNLESDLGEHQGEPLADEMKYRQLIGTLTYLLDDKTRCWVSGQCSSNKEYLPKPKKLLSSKEGLTIFVADQARRTYIEETFGKRLRDLRGRCIWGRRVEKPDRSSDYDGRANRLVV